MQPLISPLTMCTSLIRSPYSNKPPYLLNKQYTYYSCESLIL